MHGFESVVSCLLVVGLTVGTAPAAEAKIKVLVIGGQNNHDWAKSTPYMEQILKRSDRFDVTVSNTPAHNAPQAAWDAWKPKFADYGCVVLDYNGQPWPIDVQQRFVDYVFGGGGVVAIHASNNAFTGWKEYEQMVGLLWRGKEYGASLYLDEAGKLVREAPGQGRGMGHGGQYDWAMTVRDPAHPITEGMPVKWMHKHDELYHGQRGPAENVHILLTAYSDPASGRNGTGKNEPIVWWIPYGAGKVVTNVMGHVGELGCMECVGFQVLLDRSCEWAATGKCKTPIPKNFPTAEATSLAP